MDCVAHRPEDALSTDECAGLRSRGPGVQIPPGAPSAERHPLVLTKRQRERFFSQVRFDGPICAHLGTHCHLWTGSVNYKGYGVVKFDGKPILAHVAALDIAGVVVPEGMVRRHLCGVKLCVNDQHVKPGTPTENANDTEPPNRKVTDEQADQIRSEYAAASGWGAKGRLFDAWAERLGTSRRCIEYIAHGQMYRERHPLKPTPYKRQARRAA